MAADETGLGTGGVAWSAEQALQVHAGDVRCLEPAAARDSERQAGRDPVQVRCPLALSHAKHRWRGSDVVCY
eukprot:858018-Rhodomonas_salina.3